MGMSEDPYNCDAWWKIPSHNHRSIKSYVENGVPLGSFLTAVVSNDLKGAFLNADLENGRAMRDIVAWFYNEAPSGCWGSKKKHRLWGGLNHGLGSNLAR